MKSSKVSSIYIALLFCISLACESNISNQDLTSLDGAVEAIKTKTETLSKKELAQIFVDSAQVLMDSSKFEQALNLCRQAISIYSVTLNEQDTLLAKAYNVEGSLLRHTNKLDSALTSTQKALSLLRELLPDDNHRLIGESFESMGLIYQKKSKYKEALDQFQKSLEIRKEVFGGNSLEVANIYVKMAQTYGIISKYEKAQQYYEMALSIRENQLEKKDVKIAFIMGSLGSLYMNKGEYKKALIYIQKALDIYLLAYGAKDERVVPLYINLGIALKRNGDYKNALLNYQKALNINLSNGKRYQSNTAITYMNLGNLASEQGNDEQALDYHHNALEILKKVVSEEHQLVALLYGLLGNTWFHGKGNYKKALFYYQKALDINLKIFGSESEKSGWNYETIGLATSYLGKHREAIEYYEKAAAIYLKVRGEQHKNLPVIYNQFGITYNELKEYGKARVYLEKAIKKSIKIYGAYHPLNASIYNNMGTTYSSTGKYDQALFYYKKGLENRLNSEGSGAEIARNYKNIATTYTNKGDLLNARIYYGKAFKSLNFNPSEEDAFTKVNHPIILRHTLADVLNFYAKKAQESGNSMDQDSLLYQYQQLLAFDDFLQYEYPEPSMQQFHSAQIIPYYEEAINLLLNKVEGQESQIFRFFEKTKARQLAAKVQFSSEESTFGLPDTLKEKEQRLNKKIVLFENKSVLAEFKKPKYARDSLLKIYRDSLFILKNQRYELQDLLRSSYSNYYNLRYKNSVISTEEVQKDLLKNENQAFVEYFLGDSTIFTFLILPNTIKIHKMDRDTALNKWIKDFRCSLFGQRIPDSNCSISDPREVQDQYASLAYLLYEQLFSHIDSLLPKTITDVMIVPDGVLGYIPFDALLASPALKGQSYFNFDYLLNHYTFSYAYSATLQQEMQEKKHKTAPSEFLLAFAPSFEVDSHKIDSLYAYRSIDINNRRNWLSSLTYNIPEVENITQQFNGKAVLKEKASKEHFLESAHQYRIIHLSTHGKANDESGDNSFLAFYSSSYDSIENDWLFNRELYNLQLNADLVVLSACETGIGELQRGEGIISLARGFSYAGAKSIITSLWNVNDKSTQFIMEHFYQYLKNGQAKHIALRNAKIDYLKSKDINNDALRSPVYWAAFIPIGDMEAIEETRKRPGAWWVIIGLLVVLGGFTFVYRNVE